MFKVLFAAGLFLFLSSRAISAPTTYLVTGELIINGATQESSQIVVADEVEAKVASIERTSNSHGRSRTVKSTSFKILTHELSAGDLEFNVDFVHKSSSLRASLRAREILHDGQPKDLPLPGATNAVLRVKADRH